MTSVMMNVLHFLDGFEITQAPGQNDPYKTQNRKSMLSPLAFSTGADTSIVTHSRCCSQRDILQADYPGIAHFDHVSIGWCQEDTWKVTVVTEKFKKYRPRIRIN